MSEGQQIFSLEKDETAFDILSRVIQKYTKLKGKAKTKYRTWLIREFSVEASVDIHGREVPSPQLGIEINTLTIINDEIKSKPPNKLGDYTLDMLYQIERQIGAPALFPPSDKELRKNIKPKSRSQVENKLLKHRKSIAKEIKMLRQLCPDIHESQNQASIAAVETLDWILTQYVNDGINQVGMRNILQHLLLLFIRREKDKLFYVRRHPGKGKMHRCFDERLLSEIKQTVWVLGCNPYVNKKKERYGNGRARF